MSPSGFWSLAPRFGFSYPISVRDAFSLAYVRMDQDPARDYLYDNRNVILNRRPFGNLLLEPATVISYQAAVKHVFDERWSLRYRCSTATCSGSWARATAGPTRGSSSSNTRAPTRVTRWASR